MRNKKKMAASPPSQVEIPAAIVEELNDCINKASESIKPYSDTLTPEEIKRLAKANGKTLGFLLKALEFCQKNPQYLTSLFTVEEFQAYMNNIKSLMAGEMSAKQLSTLLTTTRMINAAAAFEIALNFYNLVKIAAAKNVPGAQDIYKELSARFPGRKKKKPVPAEAAHDAALKVA